MLHPAISVTDAVGYRSLTTNANPYDLAWDILDAHFGGARDRVPSRDEWSNSHPELAAALRRREQRSDQQLTARQEVA